MVRKTRGPSYGPEEQRTSAPSASGPPPSLASSAMPPPRVHPGGAGLASRPAARRARQGRVAMAAAALRLPPLRLPLPPPPYW